MQLDRSSFGTRRRRNDRIRRRAATAMSRRRSRDWPDTGEPSSKARVNADNEAVAFKLEEADLIGAGPGFVPRDIEMVDHLLALNRITARIRNHVLVKVDPVLVALRRTACLMNEQDHHAALGWLNDITLRVLIQRGALL